MPRNHKRIKHPIQNQSIISARLIELETMTVSELEDKYRELFDRDACSRHRSYLIKRLAYRIQELAYGGLSRKALARIDMLADQAPLRRRSASCSPRTPTPILDPRLPPIGGVLTRRYKGTLHKVRITSAGFEYRGALFQSLSAVAKEITCTEWNGFRFFRCIESPPTNRGEEQCHEIE
jgi:hypothetical protein